jgi:hypothetical protein
MRRDLNLKRGDAVLLTEGATASVLRLPHGATTEQRLVGMILDELEPWEDLGRVWGVLINGEAHQMLEDEFEDVIIAQVSDLEQG